MNNQTSIKYISSLLDSPGSVTDGDQSSISLFRQTFPYFVPLRYLIALESHKKTPFSPQMLSGMQPYMGDWIMFSDFLTEGCKPIDSQLAAINKVVDKKNAEINRTLTEHEAISVAQAVPLVPSAVKVDGKKEEYIPVPEAVVAKLAEQAPPVATQKTEAPAPVVNIPVVEAPAAEPVVPIVTEAKKETAPAAVSAPATEEQQPVVPPPAAPVEEVKEPDIPAAPVVSVPVFEASGFTEVYQPANEQPIFVEFIVDDQDITQVEEAAPFAEPVSAPSAEVPENAFEHDTFIEVEADNVVPAEPVEADEDAIAEAVEIVNETDSAYAEQANGKGHAPFNIPDLYQRLFPAAGGKVSEEIPLEISELKDNDTQSEEDKSLMVVMSFSEWLLHFKNSSEKQKEESKDQKALKTMWQKEKLAAAMEEENEEIPENVFEMAVNSISKEEGLVSETLAEIYIKQGKYDNPPMISPAGR